MPNKVEPGMRFRRRNDGKTFTAVREWGKGRSSINGQPDWYVEEDDSHRSLSSDDLYEPIPEPAPELCTVSSCGVGNETCSRPTPGTKEQHDRRRLKFPSTHDFVAPQAKPLLREPMPLPNGLPDVCLVCRGDTRGRNYYCTPCFDALGLSEFVRQINAWDALHRKPAAKDIPSAVVAAKCSPDTEAARGGEAAITSPTTFRRTFREYAPSAVAAAPAIEPWRPTVDDWDLLADAETGWRR